MKRIEVTNKTLYNHLQNKIAGSSRIVDMVMNEAFSKKAIYRFDKGNIHRPNKVEISTGMFVCPKCKSKLTIAPNRLINKIYVCPSCGFKIDYDKVLLTPEAIEEYQMRERQNG